MDISFALEENVQEYKRRFFNSIDENQILIIAKDGDDIIGQATLKTYFNEKIPSRQVHVGNVGIRIHPEYHDQGIGTQMFIALEDIARKKGLKKMEIGCFSTNTRAVHVYEHKLKYHREGCRKNSFIQKDGTYCDAILYGKFL